MSLWTSADAVAATGGQTPCDWVADGVSIDTRSLRPGDLFVALTAARDGHDFVAQALAQGAAAALVSRVPDGVAADAPLLIVDDVLKGLERLGIAARARSRAQIAAITGSVGKTSAKEMLRAALTGQGRVHAAEASYNNHWGVPLTLARMPVDTDFGIFEIGMSNPGEIAPLARMVKPHVAMITTVAPAHLEAFGAIEGIAHEKASITEGLLPDGTLVVNGDIATAPILIAAGKAHGARILTFGEGAGNHHRATDIHIADHHTTAQARAWRTPMMMKVASEGRHAVINGLGVLAVAQALGADPAKSLCGLGGWRPPAGRGQREVVQIDPVYEDQTFELIDDAFNANPTSMTAALEILAAARVPGRRIAILGDMLELGPQELDMHAAIARDPSMDRVDVVHTVGLRMAALRDALPDDRRGQHVDYIEQLMPQLRRLIHAGDVVLVKGSKGSFVSRAVDALRKLGHRPSKSDQED